ncbi:MAG TPA: V-type ATP synthase subunit D [Kofleriaceae bacterium]|nr:V-type ATP synthase subunit D [Kofleriaceae bacterium]
MTGGAPTRAQLLRDRRLLARVDHGIDLLRRKREALVRELVPLARPAAEARRAIADAAEVAYRAQLEAMAIHGAGEVTAAGWPPRDLAVELEPHRVWGMVVPRLANLPTWRRGLAARATEPATTGPALFQAANDFEVLADRLLAAAALDLHLRALADALERTSRQLHTLEQRVAPELRARITRVARTLDEREREEQLRLRRLRARGAR